MRSHLPYAVSGVLATLVGLGTGHLVAGLVDPASSPVIAVGATVIDQTPTPVKEWAVARFGTADKPILLASVLGVVLLLAAVSGVLARRRPALGAGLLALLVGLAGSAALLRPTATWPDVLPSLAAGAAGVATLVLLVHGLPAPDSPAGAGGSLVGRRGLLVVAGLVALAAATGSAGRLLARRLATGPGDVTLPAPADPAGPLPEGLERQVTGVSPLQTRTSDFYRIDINLVVPPVDVGDWTLTVDGDVRRELRLSYEELVAMPLVERDITLNCVSNEVGGPLVGAARWTGVRLADLLDRAGIGDRADQVLSTAVDGFTISTPLAVATDGRDALVAVGMNGAPLPREHGFPARLVTPGLYGFVGATKWLTRLTLTGYTDEEAYWTRRGWAVDAPVKVQSRIDTPRPLSTVAAGTVAVGGVAWAQHRGIERVEVRVDGGPWRPARLGPGVGLDYWRQWWLPWAATPGRHRLACRAVTLDGETQTAVRAAPFPTGASGIQEIVVTVR